MDIDTLCAQVEKPSTHQAILGSYAGPYALGVGARSATDGAGGESFLLVLSVPTASPGEFPESVVLQGEEIEIRIETGFSAPGALAAGA